MLVSIQQHNHFIIYRRQTIVFYFIGLLFLFFSFVGLQTNLYSLLMFGPQARHNMQVLSYHLHCAKQAHATASTIFLTELNTNKSLTAEVWATKHRTVVLKIPNRCSVILCHYTNGDLYFRRNPPPTPLPRKKVAQLKCYKYLFRYFQ